MTTPIVIVAGHRGEAESYATREGLKLHEWIWATAGSVRGLTSPDVRRIGAWWTNPNLPAIESMLAICDRGARSQRTSDPIPELLTLKEVGVLFRVHAKTVTRWIDDGHLPAVVLPSGRRRVRRDTVDKVLVERGLNT